MSFHHCLTQVALAVHEGREIDMCPDCEEIYARLTIAGPAVPGPQIDAEQRMEKDPYDE